MHCSGCAGPLLPAESPKTCPGCHAPYHATCGPMFQPSVPRRRAFLVYAWLVVAIFATAGVGGWLAWSLAGEMWRAQAEAAGLRRQLERAQFAHPQQPDDTEEALRAHLESMTATAERLAHELEAAKQGQSADVTRLARDVERLREDRDRLARDLAAERERAARPAPTPRREAMVEEPRTGREPYRGPRWSKGWTKSEVSAIQGTPTGVRRYTGFSRDDNGDRVEHEREVWTYGVATVTFVDGRVEEWHDYNGTLRVELR